MKCNSCGAENASTVGAFNCAYCGAENVPQVYFDEKSSAVLEVEGLSPLKQQGINNFNRKKFKNAADDLSKYLSVTSGDAEAWIFYALSEAELLKASNVDEKFYLISDALKNAKDNNAESEFLNNSEVILSSKILGNSLDAAHVYFRNSSKRFSGFGGGSSELTECLKVIENALKFPNHKSIERVNILFYGIKAINIFTKRYSDAMYLYEDGDNRHPKLNSFVKQLEDIYEDNLSKKTIDEMLLKLSKEDRVFLKKNSTKLFKEVSKSSNKSNPMNSSNIDVEKEGRGCFFYIKWAFYICIGLSILSALFV